MTAAKLPPEVFSLLHEPAQLGLTAVVATVDADGTPRTAPFGSLRAISPRRLRIGCDRGHHTYANLVRDGRASVCVVAPPDIAVSITGRAVVVKERMDALDTDAVVEIAVEALKSDMLPSARIESGATYSAPAAVLGLLERYVAELDEADR